MGTELSSFRANFEGALSRENAPQDSGCNFTLEVKVDGKRKGNPRANETISYEVIWLDRDEFKFAFASRYATSRELVSNGKQAFQILRGKARERYLIEHGYIAGEK